LGASIALVLGTKPHELPKEYLPFGGIQYRMVEAANENRAEEEAAAATAAAATEATSNEPKIKRRKELKTDIRVVTVHGCGFGFRNQKRELRPKGGGGGLVEMGVIKQHTAQTIDAKRLRPAGP
jgi:hypothetical protein